MNELTCTGGHAEHYTNLEWSHWMFSCNPDCPMEIEQQRRHDEAMKAVREAKR